jgi:hypothetical protein
MLEKEIFRFGKSIAHFQNCLQKEMGELQFFSRGETRKGKRRLKKWKVYGRSRQLSISLRSGVFKYLLAYSGVL